MTIIGKTLGNIGMGLGLRPHIGYWDGNWGKYLDPGCWDWYWGKLYWASTAVVVSSLVLLDFIPTTNQQEAVMILSSKCA